MHKISIIIFIVCFASCDTNPSKENKTANIENIVDRCYETVSIDSSKLKLGQVANLDIYNGIKNFKFGELKSSYNSCIESYSNNSKSDTCKIKGSISFLDNEWNGRLYFINEKLCRIELEESKPYLTTSYNKLNSLFGKPNLQPIKVINSNFKSVTRIQKITNKNQLKPYTESLNDILFEFSQHVRKVSKSDLSVDKPGYDPFESYFLNENGYNGEPRRMTIKYFSEIDMECIWQAKTILQLSVNRRTELLNGQETLANGQQPLDKGTSLLMRSGFNMAQYNIVKINFYNNKKMMEYFHQLEKEAVINLKNESQRKEAQEEKEILKKF